jgi:VIT1/CCC1 family predicted Fe2+/Mn2+ transporter/rubrerythrin
VDGIADGAPAPEQQRRLITELRRNWVEEMRSAELYRRLAAILPDDEPRRVLTEMSGHEVRHAEHWRHRIEALGGEVPAIRAGVRERVLPWVARVAGLASVIGLIEGGEARGKLNYLRQAHELPDAESRAIAQRILPEERQHQDAAARLRGLDTEAGRRGASRSHVGDFVRDVILGLNDGLVSNFSLIAGFSGAGASRTVVVLAGVAGLLAGGFSMAASAYLSNKSHREVVAEEVRRERDEIAYAPEEERDELGRIYRLKGFSDAEVEILVARITADGERWLETMVNEELGLSLRPAPPPLADGAFTGAGFAVGAFVPMIPFLFAGGFGALIAAGILAAVALFTAGAARSVVTSRSALRSGAEMVVIGVIAAVVVNLAGRLLGGYAAA